MGLRLPNLVLPEFTGKEPLDRFLERIQNLLITSNVPVQYWLTFVKQQCQKDSRAFDDLSSAQEKQVKLLGEDVTKAGPAEYKAHFAACIETLKEKCGIPKDQQIRELLETYYTMKQNPTERVAHRFCETQRNLDKLIPKIHCGLELLYAFVIKLRPDISRDILRESDNFKTLQSLIAAAQRYELHAGRVAQPHPDIEHWQSRPTSSQADGPTQATLLYAEGHNKTQNWRPLPVEDSGPNRPNQGKNNKSQGSGSSHKFGGKSKTRSPTVGPTRQICFHFNRNVRSACEMPKNLCQNRRQHRCFTCNQWSCKQLTLFHMGRADSALLQIVFFITSVRDAAEARNVVNFPRI